MATPIGIEFAGSLLEAGLYPVCVRTVTQSRSKVPISLWSELAGRLSAGSLRTVAKEYSISHETARRIAARVKTVRT